MVINFECEVSYIDTDEQKNIVVQPEYHVKILD